MVKQIFIISIILVGVIPAFCEEMFFRGILLTGFQENYSEKKAVLISALLFGIIHLNPWQFVSAFIIGIFSAWICIKTRSIVLSIYIHIFNNIIAVIALKYKEIVPIKGFGGDLQSMMNRGKAKRTKDDTMKNDHHHRPLLPSLP